MFHKSITLLSSLPIPFLSCLLEINESSKNYPFLDLPLALNSSGVVKPAVPPPCCLRCCPSKVLLCFLTAPPRTAETPWELLVPEPWLGPKHPGFLSVSFTICFEVLYYMIFAWTAMAWSYHLKFVLP